jgi:hypothetical protein
MILPMEILMASPLYNEWMEEERKETAAATSQVILLKMCCKIPRFINVYSIGVHYNLGIFYLYFFISYLPQILLGASLPTSPSSSKLP